MGTRLMSEGKCVLAVTGGEQGGENNSLTLVCVDISQLAPTPAESVKVINENYPHLKAKLDYMADKMRGCMGVVSWEMQN